MVNMCDDAKITDVLHVLNTSFSRAAKVADLSCIYCPDKARNWGLFGLVKALLDCLMKLYAILRE